MEKAIMTWVDFRTVRENLDVLVVLTHYGFDVKRDGQEQVKICCPFHDDAKPSCGFNSKKRVFNCFSCGEKGNILDFVARMEGFDPDNPRELRKAALHAVETFNVDGGARSTKAGDQPKAKDSPLSCPNGKKRPPKASQERKSTDTCDVSKTPRPEAPASQEVPIINPPLTFELRLDTNHSFLRDRNVGKKLVKTFGLGFAKRGSMAGRVCFPIHNEAGELIAYAGRWAEADVPTDTPRYLLPKGFEKSRVLYNLNRVIAQRKELEGEGARLDDAIVIVEGYWSVLRLHAEGVPAVACFGDSLSPEQVELLVQAGFDRAVLIFDGDEGGRKGTEQALPVLATRLFAKSLMLGDGEKPDTMSDTLVAALPRYVR